MTTHTLAWGLLHEGFPGLGWRCGEYTVRPSSVWRGLYTLRHGDQVLGGPCIADVAKLAAYDHQCHIRRAA